MLNELITRAAELTAALFPFDCMQYAFMRRAMFGLLLLSPLAAGTGIQVVNSRMAFFSDAIGHSAFAGVALGLIFAWSPDVTMPLLALLVGFLIMFLRRGSRLSSDTVIGVIFSAVVAFGLAVVSRSRGAARSSQTFLFGDILTIGDGELAMLILLLLVFWVFQYFAYNRMICIAINPQLATVHRIRTAWYQYAFTALLSLTVIYSVRAVGVLLVTALLIVPAATARNFAKNSCQMFWFSQITAIFSAVTGLLISAQDWAGIPAGAAVVLCSCACFCVSSVFASFRPAKTADSEK